MIGNVDHTPIRMFVVDSEVITFRIACKEREEIRNFAEATDIDSFFDRELEDRPERVGISFTHWIVETQVLRCWCTGGWSLLVLVKRRCTRRAGPAILSR